MAVLSLSSLLLLASPALAATGIAQWAGLRGTRIQSIIVLEGGLLTHGDWDPTTSSYQSTAPDTAPYGLYYQINLTNSFDVRKDALDTYMYTNDKMQIGSSTQNPDYYWGGIFNNDFSWYTLGGMADRPPLSGSTTVIRGDVFQSAPGQKFFPSVQPNQETSNIEQYVSNGAYASTPDGMGYYFSGMHGENFTALEFNSGDLDPNHPTITSPTFVQVDMTSSTIAEKNTAVFTSLQFPTWMTPRAEGALIWLPYGTKGVLVAIGGAEIPGDLYLATPPRDLVSNNTFMTNLSIYDIDSQTWYIQETREETDRPTQLASFCSAAVPTKDGHGWEIFVYGGYDGAFGQAVDDVWELSVPAFQWTRVIDGSKSLNHSRRGSVCVAPNPTTMISVGGTGQGGAYLTSDHGVDVLDLNNLTWTGQYDASSDAELVLQDTIWTNAKYPDANGPGNGPVTNLDSTLNTLFSTKYSGKAIAFGPYASAPSSNSTTTSTPTPTPAPASGNHTLAIALGVAIPVVVIAALLLGFCCLKKRRKNKEGVQRTQESRGGVLSWLGKSSPIDPAPEKSHTSDETAVNSTEYTHDKQPISEVFEAPGSNPTTPGWGNHGSPRVLSGSMATSPFMGSAEVDAQSRHEIMDHAPRHGQSFRQHPMYPRSFSGDQVTSMRSDSISHASTSVMPSRHYGGYVSPSYELPQDRSREDLTAPPADVNLGAPRADANPNASTHSLGLGAEHVHSPVALIPVAPVSRKPVNKAGQDDDRPRHQRNQSSMSSDVPNLPSPGPEEDRRRSRLIDTLPDPKSGQSSPIQPQTAKRSVYKEDLES